MLSIPVSPVPSMSRRVPLGNIPNNALSPYSAKTAVPAKRSAKPSRDILGLPPAKKAHIEDGSQGVEQKENRLTTPSKIRLVPKTPSRQDAVKTLPCRMGRSKPTVAGSRGPPPVFQHDKLDPQARSKKPAPKMLKEKNNLAGNDIETVKQWQRHYWKVFPTLTFYFDDSMPNVLRENLRNRLLDIGSTVMFSFSARLVTHVITARIDIPPEMPKEEASGTGTIDPKLLSSKGQSNGKLNVYDDHRDVLVVARIHSKKIWTAEKLDRMIDALYQKHDDDASMATTRVSKASVKLLPHKPQPPLWPVDKDADKALDEMLRHDKARASQPVAKEMYYFKGPYIMVGDATGRYRPFIVREFSVVKNNDNGDWPQFRSNREGRCPFVLDPDTKRHQREEAEIKAAKEKQTSQARPTIKGSAMQPPPRNHSLNATTKDVSAKSLVDRKPLSSIENKVDRDLATSAAATAVEKADSRSDKAKEAHRTRGNMLVMKGYEPVASGIRATGPTSAVASQTISSNTAIVGAKAGTSRDVHRLNRRVFEKTTVGIKQTANLQAVGEETRVDVKTERKNLKRTRSEMLVKEVKKQPVAGYCENCRDKYDDFDEHIASKRHMKFAANPDNFKELDELLASLARPRKGSMSRTPSY